MCSSIIFVAGDLGERGAVASQSAQRAGGESAGEAASRDNLTTYSSKYDRVCHSKIPFPLKTEGRSQVKRAGVEGKRLTEANRRVKIKIESLRQASSSAR